MMKQVFRLCLAAMLCLEMIPLNAQIMWKTDVEMGNLRGKVKELTLYEITEQKYFHADTLAKLQQQGLKPPYYKREISSKATYDKYGYFMENTSFGSLGGREVYSYSGPGKVLEQKSYDTDGTLLFLYTFTYDAEGKAKQATRTNYKTGESVFVETFEHFPKTRTMICTHTNTNGSSQVQLIEKYKNGKIKHLCFSSEGKTIQEMFFDKKGNVTESLMGSRKTYVVWASHKRTNTTYQLDDEGNRTLVETTEATLDDYGNVLREEKRSADGTLLSFDERSYQYDQQGNWIRCERKNSRDYLNLTYEREITYY